jgi:hypothetical protein
MRRIITRPIPFIAGPSFGSHVCALIASVAIGFGLTVTRADAGHFDDQVRPLLVKYCQECHSGEKPKGDFRVDRLSADFADELI